MRTKLITVRKLVRSAPSFDEAIDTLLREGITQSRGRAIWLARQHDSEGYDAWMSRRHRFIGG